MYYLNIWYHFLYIYYLYECIRENQPIISAKFDDKALCEKKWKKKKDRKLPVWKEL